MTIDPDRIAVAGKMHVYFKCGVWRVRWADEAMYGLRGMANSVGALGRELFMARIAAQRLKRRKETAA